MIYVIFLLALLHSTAVRKTKENRIRALEEDTHCTPKKHTHAQAFLSLLLHEKHTAELCFVSSFLCVSPAPSLYMFFV